MRSRALLFIFSLILSGSLSAQFCRLGAIQFGVDPVRSLTLLNKNQDNTKLLYSPRMAEAYAELMLFGQTSLVAEFGYSRSHYQIPSGNYHYYSKGSYTKIGINFDITDWRDRAEISLGCRFGFTGFSEKARISLLSYYYGEEYTQEIPEQQKFFMWGEFLVNYKYKLSEAARSGNRIYFLISLKLKATNVLPAEGYPSLVIPGYGFHHKFEPGISFGLLYHYKVKRSKMKELKYKKRNDLYLKKHFG